MIAALVPAKPLDRAKGRLAALLSEDERRRLAAAMLHDVLRALQAVRSIDLLAVVSPDEEVLAQAGRLGAQAISEPAASRGVNQALAHALNVMSPQPRALLALPADLPTASPIDIESVLQALPGSPGVVVCPSTDRGTTALALQPPDAIPFRFGRQSFQAHKREAAARGIPVRVLRPSSLATDIDGPDDLLRLADTAGPTATHRLLAQLRLAERLPAPRAG